MKLSSLTLFLFLVSSSTKSALGLPKNSGVDENNKPALRSNKTRPHVPEAAATTQVNHVRSRSDSDLGPARQVQEELEDGSRIDIMVAWTVQAECEFSQQLASCQPSDMTEDMMKILVDELVAQTNQAFSNSGVTTVLNLVHSYRVETNDYEDAETVDTILSNLRTAMVDDAQGPFGVRANRNQYFADLVTLIASPTDTSDESCGAAYEGYPEPTSETTLSVVKLSCIAAGEYTFTKGIGSNLGCFADRGSEDACDEEGLNYGFRDEQYRFRTVMAADCAANQCDSFDFNRTCPAILRFSNPDGNYNYQGLITGVPGYIDCAQQLNIGKVAASNIYYNTVSGFTPFPTSPPTPAPVPPPSPSPTTSPTANPTTSMAPTTSFAPSPFVCDDESTDALSTYAGTSTFFASGVLFEVKATIEDLVIESLDIATNFDEGVAMSFEVWTKQGSYDSTDFSEWTKIYSRGTVESTGRKQLTPLGCFDDNQHVLVEVGSTQAFYVTLIDETGILINYGGSDSAGSIFQEQEKLQLFVGGSVKHYPFDTVFPHWAFNGVIHYSVAPTPSPTMSPTTSSPTSNPTQPPTSSPTTSKPSLRPTVGPTESPQEPGPTLGGGVGGGGTPEPSGSPTASPTPNPTPGPTPSPTPNPTPGPTPAPTPNPTPGPTPAPTPSPTPAPTPSPTAGGETPAENCCSSDFKTCTAGWCSLAASNCGNCGGLWMDVTQEDEACIPRYGGGCTIFADKTDDCCGEAQCKGGRWYKQCKY